MPRIAFTPERELDTDLAALSLTVKGQSPRHAYPFRLIELYPEVPALGLREVYTRLRVELNWADEILHRRLRLRSSLRLAEPADEAEASGLLAALFDPRRRSATMANPPPPTVALPNLFRLDAPRPFALERAGERKLLHTLVWIDANVKVMVERTGAACGMSVSDTREVVRIALTVYCLLVKMQDYRLARAMNFNHSMFLQDRIVNLIFGDALFFAGADAAGDLLRVGALSNQIALDLLRGLGPMSHRQLCVAAIFMGVVWTADAGVQHGFQADPDAALATLAASLNRASRRLCVDEAEDFLRYVGGDPTETIVAVLDDNGESVFDIALFQRLLRDTHRLKVEFLVNRFPVSNNIAVGTLEALLADDYFADLRRFREQGRVLARVETQAFRSFEHAYLLPQTTEAMRRAGRLYIKGQNFFETLQPTSFDRYYCFAVSGLTSQMLTGCPEGSGILAKVPAGCDGYLYEGPDRIRTLRDLFGGGQGELAPLAVGNGIQTHGN